MNTAGREQTLLTVAHECGSVEVNKLLLLEVDSSYITLPGLFVQMGGLISSQLLSNQRPVS